MPYNCAVHTTLSKAGLGAGATICKSGAGGTKVAKPGVAPVGLAVLVVFVVVLSFAEVGGADGCPFCCCLAAAFSAFFAIFFSSFLEGPSDDMNEREKIASYDMMNVSKRNDTEKEMSKFWTRCCC